MTLNDRAEIKAMIDKALKNAFILHNEDAHQIKLKMIAEGLAKHVKDFHGDKKIK